MQAGGFSEAQLQTLEAVCRTLVPPGDAPANGTPLADEFAGYLRQSLSPEELRQIGTALSLLDSRLLNGLLTAQFRRLTALEQTGTAADCTSRGKAVYYAWIELVPDPPTMLKLAVAAGEGAFRTCTILGAL